MKYPKDQSKKDPKTLRHFLYLTGQVMKLKVHNLLFCGEAIGFGENFVSQLAGSILFIFACRNARAFCKWHLIHEALRLYSGKISVS